MRILLAAIATTACFYALVASAHPTDLQDHSETAYRLTWVDNTRAAQPGDYIA